MALSLRPTWPLIVTSEEEIDSHVARLWDSAALLQEWLKAHAGDPADLLFHLKFVDVGFDPLNDRRLNAIEQVNQTWTYAVALAAARQLLQLHREADGFQIAPGAHMAIPLDVMSVKPNLVGAEIFATVNHRNNRKLTRDIAKMTARPEQCRYVFFFSPEYPKLERLAQFSTDQVEVWSVAI